MKLSRSQQDKAYTYPLVPFSNEYVNEFKNRTAIELQFKKDEIKELENILWEEQGKNENQQKHYQELL